MQNNRILFTTPEGTLSVIVPAPGATLEQCLKAVPEGVAYEVVAVADVPADRTFRNAWKHDTSPAPEKVAVDMLKAKDISHEKRRAKRAAEFAPLDVEATIPGKAAQAEAKRQAVRDKHDALQVEIENAGTPEALKAVLVREAL
jgi:hypothetical protein